MHIITTNDIAPHRTRIEELEARLHHGDTMIRQLEAENKPVDHLVNHWLELLREYEIEFRADQSAA